MFVNWDESNATHSRHPTPTFSCLNGHDPGTWRGVHIIVPEFPTSNNVLTTLSANNGDELDLPPLREEPCSVHSRLICLCKDGMEHFRSATLPQAM